MMDEKKVEYFKDLLLGKRDEVFERIQKLREITMESNYKDSYGDHSGYAFHMADQGIEQALQRIDLNEYGICRVCGQEIDEQRLEIVPTTRICVPCKLKESKSKP
jgi:RNA polymerase-binding transcription factor DksA